MIWEKLAEEAWVVQDGALPEEHWKSLAALVRSEDPQFQAARIGRGSGRVESRQIRGDLIRWLDAREENPILQKTWAWLESLRTEMNRELQLGLRRFEAHFALYPPGAGYEKHVDQHRGQAGRKITFVLYLNEGWTENDGGEIEMDLGPAFDSEPHRISPIGGRLVLFRSELIPHAVRASTRVRKSLTGWFRDDEAPWGE